MNHNRNLLELLGEFFKASLSPDSDAYQLKGWHIHNISSFLCPKCQKNAEFLVCSGATSSFDGACLYCPQDAVIFWSDSVSVQVRNKMDAEFNIVFDSTEESTSWPREEELRKQASKTQTDSAKSTNSMDESSDAFAPKGFRQVGWLREEEAKAIISAYEQNKSTSIINSEGLIKGEARYYPDGSPEVEKYKSNVHLVRFRKSGERWVGWIRLEEAQAILKALETKANVAFGHKEFGKGGEVHYYSPDSEMAKRFLSQTRLLRRS